MEACPGHPVPGDACAAISDLRRHLPGEVDGQDPGDTRQDEVQLQECKEDHQVFGILDRVYQ